MDKIISAAASVYECDQYFCFTKFVIRFTDCMLFLSLYLGDDDET